MANQAFISATPVPVRSATSGSKGFPTKQSAMCSLAERESQENLSKFVRDNPPKGASLPQHASRRELTKRASELKKNQERYIYKAPDNIPGISFLKSIEGLEDEKPSIAWLIKFKIAEAKGKINFREFDQGSIPSAIRDFFGNLTRRTTTVQLGDDPDRAVRIARGMMNKLAKIKKSTVSDDFEERSSALSQFRELYKFFPLPAIADVFMQDDVFCRLRVAGYNPMTLFAVTSEDELPIKVTDEHLLPGDSIRTAITENRLFAIDYSILSNVEQDASTQKRFAVCKALFSVAPGVKNGDLNAIAIELDGDLVLPPKKGDEGFPTSWTIAKLAVNVCDTLHHQLIAHLCRTHLVVEPFILATMRQLAPEHPVRKLLRPHMEGTAAINESAAKTLVQKDGPVDRILAGDLSAGVRLVSEFMRNVSFNGSMPDKELETRGMMHDTLKMPYRDDALQHWDALNEWVLSYLSLFYTSPDAIADDKELQNWADEVVDPSRGMVVDFGNNGDGVIRDVKYLARAVSYIIFASSVQHAAVNFPQSSIMLYPPAVAGHLWGDVPDADERNGIAPWSNLLVPLQGAIDQISVFSLLGGVYHTQLGQYSRRALPRDRRVTAALEVYQKKLEDIEKAIEMREKNSVVKYEFLRSSRIPQSTNI